MYVEDVIDPYRSCTFEDRDSYRKDTCRTGDPRDPKNPLVVTNLTVCELENGPTLLILVIIYLYIPMIIPLYPHL